MDNTVDIEAPEDTEVIDTEDIEDTQEETPVSFTFAGKDFTSQVEAEHSYKEMQKVFTQATQKLKTVEKQIETEMFKAEFQNLDPDEKIERLAELMLAKQDAEVQVEEVEEALEVYDDTDTVQSYADNHPILSEYPELSEVFVELATTKYKTATLESLFTAKIKPLIEKLGNKSVTVKKKVVGTTQTHKQFSPEAISKMSPDEYEKNRAAILSMA